MRLHISDAIVVRGVEIGADRHRLREGEEAVPTQQIDYKTHILLASTSSDRMTAICHWPYVPRQIEVAQKIDAVQETYAGRLTYG